MRRTCPWTIDPSPHNSTASRIWPPVLIREKDMTTLAQSVGEIRKPWKWIAAAGAVLLVWGAVAFPKMASVNFDNPSPTTQADPAIERYVALPRAAQSVAQF